MFNFVYNDLDSDNYLNDEYDKNSSSIQILDSYESLDSQKNFLNNKTKQKTYKEEKSHTFKKEKKIDEFNEKKKIKDNISSKELNEIKKSNKIYLNLKVCIEIKLEVLQNKKIVCYSEKNIQTENPYDKEND